MKLTIDHTTHYRYGTEVLHSIQYIRLTPPELPSQHIRHWSLDLSGSVRCSKDAFGNVLHVTTIDRPHSELMIRATGEVEIEPAQGESANGGLSPVVYLRNSALTKMNDALISFAEPYREAGMTQLLDMMHELLDRVPYQAGHTDAYSSAIEAFTQGKGVCQDHTHIFVACCRWLGVPARYISGYLYTEKDAHVASHAWAEAWVNDRWHTFDVSNGLSSASHHLKLAQGIDYLDACPVRGVRWGGGEEMLHAYALVDLVDQGQAQIQQ